MIIDKIARSVNAGKSGHVSLSTYCMPFHTRGRGTVSGYSASPSQKTEGGIRLKVLKGSSSNI